MAILDVKFTKFDNRPWGFRLAGGSDFPEPLTVIRVTEGSLAECMGLKVGDVVVKLNDQWINELSHGQAHESLVLAGNNFVLGVRRTENPLQSLEGIENKIEPYMLPLEEILFFPIEEKRESIPDEFPQIEDEFAPVFLSSEERKEIEIYPEKPRDEDSEIVANTNLTDEEIAQLILDEEEVLDEKGVLGVNFKKLRPRAPLLKQSKVFQELQQQANSEPKRVQELKRRTTFLQKPERPVPQLRADPPATESYRVVIQKQPRKPISERLGRRALSEQTQSTRSSEVSPAPETAGPNCKTPESIVQLQDSEIGSRPQSRTETNETEKITTIFDNYQEEIPDNQIKQKDPERETQMEPLSVTIFSSSEAIAKATESMDQKQIRDLITTEISLERQLESVQSQLLALKQLPSEIERHLAMVSEQLHKIMELSGVEKIAAKLPAKADVTVIGEMHEVQVPEEEITRPMKPEEWHQEQNQKEQQEQQEQQVLQELQEPTPEAEGDIESVSSESSSYPPHLISTEDTWTELKELEISVKSNEDDSRRVKKYIVSYESKVLQEMQDAQRSRISSPLLSHGSFEPDPKLTLQEQLVQELKQRKGRKLSQELWHPQAKQLELTYGRKWRCPNDFFNDEMIADTLCSQAEVIRGRALGVNFKKFEKTALPNYDHLINSSVFKMIHKMEIEPKKGIPVRPSKVIAAEDIIERVNTPICCIADDRSMTSISH